MTKRKKESFGVWNAPEVPFELYGDVRAGVPMRVLHVTGGIYHDQITSVYKQLEAIEKSVTVVDKDKNPARKSAIPLHVMISSEGGSISVGMTLYELFSTILPQRGYKVVTHALSQISSAASVVFLSGAIRVVYATSHALLHGASVQHNGTNTVTSAVYAERYDNFSFYQRMLKEVYHSKTSLADELILSIVERQGMTFGPDELLRYGFATHKSNNWSLREIEFTGYG